MGCSEICEYLRNLRFVTLLLLAPLAGTAQTQAPSAAPSATPTSDEETIVPTFETQKLARTYILDVPAPRGQITDRNGVPLARNRLSYNLAINFPHRLIFPTRRRSASPGKGSTRRGN